MNTRNLFIVLAAAACTLFPISAPGAAGGTISGRVLDSSGGLPISGADVELDRAGKNVATSKSDAAGNYRFTGEPEGVYDVVARLSGYSAAQSADIYLTANADATADIALTRSIRGGGLREIASVRSGRNALQTTTTINQHVDPSILQSENFVRIGDYLGTLPGITAQTGSSVGDDLSLSIRGFDSSETATLLDGHPIGPIGAYGRAGVFNYQSSPFWGLSGTDVIFGSGAAGAYGTTTIAGAVDFQTLSPTRIAHAVLQQGIGSNGKTLTGFQYTNSFGRLGVALAHGIEGTYGQFDPANMTQRANLAASAVYTDPNGVTPPDLTGANLNANTYLVTGDYRLRNDLAKFTYDIDDKTSLELAAFNLNSWDDKTGEGDNDFLPYQDVLYNAQNNILNNDPTTVTSFVLPNGSTASCTGTIAVKTDSPAGFSCLTAQQYAQEFSGPAGGGINRYQAIRLQDYHGRLSRRIGAGTVSVDGFIDNYDQDTARGVGGPYQDRLAKTRGFLLSDAYSLKRNDVSFGFYYQSQEQDYKLNSVPNSSFRLGTNSFFVRDAFKANEKLAFVGNLWLQHSQSTKTTEFDPRLSLVYRPTNADVVRFTGGRAFSEPSPSLVVPVANLDFAAVGSLNPICGPGRLNSIATVTNPNLKPETANDVELAYGHRFNPSTTFQVDAYSANEQNAILNGNTPISAIPAYAVDPAYVASVLAKIGGICGTSPTSSVLGYTTFFNAAQGRYNGINLDASFGVVRNVSLGLNFGIQSATYRGIPLDLQATNPNLIDGGQIYGIPFRKGVVSLDYGNNAGVHARIDGNYVGAPNSFNRGPYWYANGTLSKTTGGVTVNLGLNNIFNSVAQQWGYVGLGTYQPENAFGSDTNAFQQGSEQFGLPFRQIWLTVTTRI